MQKDAVPQLDVSRSFAAPLSALYHLCASPTFFKHCGAGSGLFDFRVGGRYEFAIGKDDFVRGEFKEIVPYEKIAMTWTTNTPFGLCDGTLVTLMLSGDEKSSQLRVVHTGFATADIAKCHDEGWLDLFATVAERFGTEMQKFLATGLQLRFTVAETFKKPVSEVFAAFIVPEMLKTFFVKDTTGPLVQGNVVEWTFRGWDHAFKVHCTEVVKDRTIKFSWAQTRVSFDFEATADAACKLSIHCEGWGLNQQSLDDSYSECEGWRAVLCALKAKLEFGVDI